MTKKLVVVLVIIVGVALVGQAVYTSYLVRKKVDYDMQMRKQEVELLTKLIDQISALNMDTNKPIEEDVSTEKMVEVDKIHNTTKHVNVVPEKKNYYPPVPELAKKNSNNESALNPHLIDNFEKQGNIFGGRSGTYRKEPSGVVARKSKDVYYGDSGNSLELSYKKESEGGSDEKGGWCGYYSVIKQGPRKYFDASAYTYLTFQLKGKKGGESFKIGVADESWYQLEDSMKSEKVDFYLEEIKVTTEWQKAKIPLADFMVDTKKLASISICFEAECFPEGGGKGTVFIDDLQFE